MLVYYYSKVFHTRTFRLGHSNTVFGLYCACICLMTFFWKTPFKTTRATRKKRCHKTDWSQLHCLISVCFDCPVRLSLVPCLTATEWRLIIGRIFQPLSGLLLLRVAPYRRLLHYIHNSMSITCWRTRDRIPGLSSYMYRRRNSRRDSNGNVLRM